jgi:hypothetical protein
VKALLLGLLAACGTAAIPSGEPTALPAHQIRMLDTTPKERRRMVPPEVYLRAYLAWFGGLVPLEVQQRARAKGLFDAWDDYLAALGLPDYKTDLPRQDQSNTLMLATLGRLGEALCARAAEHDLHGGKTPLAQRVVFAFTVSVPGTAREADRDVEPDGDAAFAERFDVLHRTFLGYPATLAPGDRTAKFHALFDGVVARHATGKTLTATETGWVAVCTALIEHPEAELY